METFFIEAIRRNIHAELQDFVQVILREPLRKAMKNKIDPIRRYIIFSFLSFKFLQFLSLKYYFLGWKVFEKSGATCKWQRIPLQNFEILSAGPNISLFSIPRDLVQKKKSFLWSRSLYNRFCYMHHTNHPIFKIFWL